jgi:hypothetical protein
MASIASSLSKGTVDAARLEARATITVIALIVSPNIVPLTDD